MGMTITDMFWRKDQFMRKNCGRVGGIVFVFLIQFKLTTTAGVCSPNCYGPCDMNNGECTGGCIDGWYGRNCTQGCSETCGPIGCDRTNGTCVTCLSGYWGLFCGKECSKYCKSENNDCFKENGNCMVGSCLKGWYGDDCLKQCNISHCEQCADDTNSGSAICVQCEEGRYGTSCNEYCSKNCLGGSVNCNMEGKCLDGCTNGFYGDRCDSQCPNNCKACISSNNCSECEQGFYGNVCSFECSENCQTNECFKYNGSCIAGCKPYYFGILCDRRCYIDKCIYCTKTGTSVSCGTCEDGWFGNYCLHECSPRCKENICNLTTGACSIGCVEGYYGDMCSNNCSIIQNCLDCTLASNNLKCTNCKSGFWGNNCSKACSENCKSGNCNQTNGICLNGCTLNTFGSTCNSTCSENCRHFHNDSKVCDGLSGSCLQGCKSGWHGEMCTDKEARLDVSVIVVAVVCCTAGLFLLILISVIICRLRKKPEEDYSTRGVSFHRIQTHSDNNKTPEIQNPPVTDFADDCDEFIIRRDRLLVTGTLLGAGQVGRVNRGKFYIGTLIMDVALKTVKDIASSRDVENFVKELDIFKKLRPHPNIVSFLGIYHDEVSGSVSAVLEYCTNGDLRTYLRNCQDKVDAYGKLSDEVMSTFFKFALNIANGMKYLAEMKVIHRDLAARNVLLNSQMEAKITDFGLARNESIYIKATQDTPLPLKWMAIESLTKSIYSTASDVWSFGILLWEIFSLGKTPYPGIRGHQLPHYLERGKRSEKPEHCHDKIYHVMLRCWEDLPESRPSFEWLHNAIREISNTTVAVDTIIPQANLLQDGDYLKPI